MHYLYNNTLPSSTELHRPIYRSATTSDDIQHPSSTIPTRQITSSETRLLSKMAPLRVREKLCRNRTGELSDWCRNLPFGSWKSLSLCQWPRCLSTTSTLWVYGLCFFLVAMYIKCPVWAELSNAQLNALHAPPQKKKKNNTKTMGHLRSSH